MDLVPPRPKLLDFYARIAGEMKLLLRAAAIWAILLPVPSAPAALPAANHFRFAILGDRTGGAQPGIFEQVWREVDRYHPDFVINVGDLIEGGNDAMTDREWRDVQVIWRPYAYPLYFTPGNHDIWSPESEKLYEKYTGRPPFYSFDFQATHFTILDNSRSDTLSDDQLKFLDRDLAAHESAPVKFVFFHRPDWLLPLKFQSDFPLRPILIKHHVTVVVSGHTHRFDHLKSDGVAYLCAGSSGGHLRGTGFRQGWFYHYVQVQVDQATVDMRVKEMDPPAGQGRNFNVREWSDHVP